MLVIVQNLKLATDSRTGTLIHFRINKILDSAVCTFSDLEIYSQDKVLISTGSYDVTAIGRFGTATLHNLKDAVFHLPAFGRESRKLRSSPAFVSLTIPQQSPTFFFLTRRKSVDNQISFRCSLRFRCLITFYVCRTDTDILPAYCLAFVSSVADSVYLQSDKSDRSHIVPDISTRHSVDPCTDRVAYRFDTCLIPCIVLESRTCRRIPVQRINPVSASFVIDTTRPGTFRGINLELITVYTALVIFFFAFTANLYS